MIQRCDWCGTDPLYMDYHDKEWGVPVYDDHKLFEFLILEGMQAGLSWITILRKRDDMRKAFADFDAEKLACFTDKKIEKLMLNEKIIRNRLKINSVVTNAQAYLKLQAQEKFSDFLWQFVGNKSIVNHWKVLKEISANTEISDQMSKALKQKGFKFVGSTICYAFMQATGMVNDHLVDCSFKF